jgi:valyl-tRNA synthetase
MNDSLLCVKGGTPGLISHFQEVLSVIHRLKSENGVDPGKKVAAFCTATALKPFSESLKHIAKLDSITFTSEELISPSRAVALVTDGMVALELIGLKDVVGERKKLEDERSRLVKELETLNLRLRDKNFTAKAPAEAVTKVSKNVDIKRARLLQIESLL